MKEGAGSWSKPGDLFEWRVILEQSPPRTECFLALAGRLPA